MDSDLPADQRDVTALQKIRLVSQALSDAARRTRISTRSRRAYSGGGFQARRGARAIRWAVFISFYAMVAAPTLAGVAYYGFIAADQYVAVTDFTVAGGEPIPIDGLGALTGIPAMAIVQDTQIVVNYLQSRAALEKLQGMIDIRGIYANPAADRLARFDPSKPIERFVAYWKTMTSATIKMPAGSVELRVRAFSPQDASRVAQAVLTICEELINELNERMNRDAVASARQQLAQAAARLTDARTKLEQARNDQGMLDATKAADALNKLITETRSGLLQMQEQYNTQLKFVAETAPQARALKTRIDTTKAQIDDLEAQLTNTRPGADRPPTLSGSMTKFAELDLENKVDERLFAGATAALEASRLIAERKMMYLNTFVKPVEPEQAEYPKRGLQIFLIFAASLAAWGLCCGLAATIRNNMA